MKPENPQIDSALHVLKGAVQKVLGATLTTGVYAEGNKGRLTVEYNIEYNKNPTEQQMQEIEQLANHKIQENAPIEIIEMERSQAEAAYGKIIYDQFPVPAHVQKLSITRILNWNLNCCRGPHVKTTGELHQIKILKWRARRARNELEISFEVSVR